jgi:hypothetical protein
LTLDSLWLLVTSKFIVDGGKRQESLGNAKRGAVHHKPGL